MSRPNVEEKNCVICGNKFYVRKGNSRHTKPIRSMSVRSRNSKTCSRKCSIRQGERYRKSKKNKEYQKNYQRKLRKKKKLKKT